MIEAIVKVAERVPDLRIVIDHLPHSTVPTEQDARDHYWANLRLLAGSPRVFVKLSQIPVRVNGKLMTDQHYYQASLDAIWNIFGEDHILFGSDWPNSEHVATYAQTFAIMRGYVGEGRCGARKILLEEFDCGVQVGTEKFESACAVNELHASTFLRRVNVD